MECMVKADGMGEWRDREQTQKDVNVGQERPRGGEMWKKKNNKTKIHTELKTKNTTGNKGM